MDSTRSVTVGDPILYAETGSPEYGTRAERALALYQEHGDDIRRIGPETYLVPSCSSECRRHYLVRYGGLEESCNCPDRVTPCKHLLSVGIMHAARRSGVQEVRTVAVVAGDPFKLAARRRPKGCSWCFGGYITVSIEEDGQQRDEAVPCRRCAGDGA